MIEAVDYFIKKPTENTSFRGASLLNAPKAILIEMSKVCGQYVAGAQAFSDLYMSVKFQGRSGSSQ